MRKAKFLILCSGIMFGGGVLLRQMTPAVSAPLKEDGAKGAYTNENIPLITYEFKGRLYVCSTTHSNIVKEPRWEYESNEPPLSVKSALLIAEHYARRQFSSGAPFMPLQIVLKRWLGNMWYYDIQFEPSFHGRFEGGFMQPFEVAVLMDGTVAEPEEEILDPTSHRYIPKPK